MKLNAYIVTPLGTRSIKTNTRCPWINVKRKINIIKWKWLTVIDTFISVTIWTFRIIIKYYFKLNVRYNCKIKTSLRDFSTWRLVNNINDKRYNIFIVFRQTLRKFHYTNRSVVSDLYHVTHHNRCYTYNNVSGYCKIIIILL